MNMDRTHHETLKYRLRLAGSSMAKIAASLGVTQSSVTVVSQGYRRSHRIEAAIALQLGETPEAIFPDRYKEQKTHPNS